MKGRTELPVESTSGQSTITPSIVRKPVLWPKRHSLRVPAIQQRRASPWMATHSQVGIWGRRDFGYEVKTTAEFCDGAECNPSPATKAIWSPFWD